MKIHIVPHSPGHRNAVDAFNRRMHDAGSRWGFYTESICDWIPNIEGRRVWRDYYLAIEEDGTVRGGYALKPQPWWIAGREQLVTDWQGPISEGAISNRFAALGLRMVRDMLKKRSLLYSWGHGGDDEPVVQMLRKMGWLIHPTPACVYVVRPYRFLRRNRYLRTSPARAFGLDALATSGLGWIGIKLLHAFLAAKRGTPVDTLGAQAEVVAQFGPWADSLWERCAGDYAAIAIRSADLMNTLLPVAGPWPNATRLRVRHAQADLGWAAVMITEMKDDARFGSMRMGSIIDCLARPQDAAVIVAAATRYLREQGVDMILSNQAHPLWAAGFGANGYAVLPGKRLFAASPALKAALHPWDQVLKGLHLTNLDGHGPHGL